MNGVKKTESGIFISCLFQNWYVQYVYNTSAVGTAAYWTALNDVPPGRKNTFGDGNWKWGSYGNADPSLMYVLFIYSLFWKGRTVYVNNKFVLFRESKSCVYIHCFRTSDKFYTIMTLLLIMLLCCFSFEYKQRNTHKMLSYTKPYN